MSLLKLTNITPLTTIPKNILIQKIAQSNHKSINPFKISYSQQNKSHKNHHHKTTKTYLHPLYNPTKTVT
jgi:hypothetical protein